MHFYPANYVEARDAFRATAQAAGARLETHLLPGHRGSQDEELTIDVAVLGPEAPEKALLSISGTHGAEGLPGSAAQTSLLRTLAQTSPPSDIGCVLVHALNPYGVSWASRGNENFVDLSRNFVDFASAVSRNDDYDRFHEAYAPDDWTPSAPQKLSNAVQAAVAEIGPAAALTGLTGGQFHEPTGMNYGGTGAEWSRTVLESVCQRHLGAVRKLAYTDFHSGFGAYGEAFIVCLLSQNSPLRERLASWWGPLNHNEDAFGVGAVPAWRGTIWDALTMRLAPQAEICGGVIEFGTFPTDQIGEALMIDRWLRFGKSPDDEHLRTELRTLMIERFAPSDQAWREKVVARGLRMQSACLAGLSNWN